MAPRQHSEWIAETPAEARADVPAATGVRARDPDAVERRIDERLADLRAQNIMRSARRLQDRVTARRAWPVAEESAPPQPFIKRNWQRRAEARLAAVTWDGPDPADTPIAFSAAQRARLGRRFLAAVGRGDFAAVMIFLEEGFPVNYRDPGSEKTALHIAAGGAAWPVLAALLATGQCDFLLRDRQGRLPSELAFIDGDHPALARLLGWKEQRQGAAQGVAVPRRLKQPADG